MGTWWKPPWANFLGNLNPGTRCVVFNGIVEQALLSTGGAEPRDHGLERRTSLEWGHGGHRCWRLFFEKLILEPACLQLKFP